MTDHKNTAILEVSVEENAVVTPTMPQTAVNETPVVTHIHIFIIVIFVRGNWWIRRYWSGALCVFQLVSFPPNADDFRLKLNFRRDVQVRVDNPQKIVEPLETFITYRVTTKVTRVRSPCPYVVVFDLVCFRPTERIFCTKNTSFGVVTTISYGSDKTSWPNIPIVLYP